MTAIFGIKTPDGALIASDCLVTICGMGRLRKKLRGAVHRNGSSVSGVFLAASGTYDVLPGTRILEGVERHRYFAHRLSAHFLENATEHPEGDDFANMREEAAQTTRGHSIGLLRFANTRPPDIGVLTNGTFVAHSDYFALGTGSAYVEPILKKGHPSCRDVHDAVELCTEALSRVLDRRGEFQGYQIAFARRLGTDPLSLMYTISLSAERVPRDLRFRDFLS